MSKWPSHYPDQCPPSEAEDVTGKIFRFSNKGTPKAKDFESHFERDPNKDWGAKACQSRGLSVFSTEEGCHALAAAIPAMKKKAVCMAELPREAGVTVNTPSHNQDSHQTLWPRYSAQKLAELFKPATFGGEKNV